MHILCYEPEDAVIIFRRLAFSVLLGSVALLNTAHAQTGVEDSSVIELFTSQSCSSCPPADHLLRELSRDPHIIAMSFPVNYWDYLGWKDTLARRENSARQHAYADRKGETGVYTPQVIVNGLEGCVGSDRAKIEAALKDTAAIVHKAAVALKVHRDGERLIIETGAAPDRSEFKTGKVWVASIMRSADVPIKRGENAGKMVTYTNVVRNLTEVGEWQGAPASYMVPLKEAQQDGDLLVVFLQAEHSGPIVGAARIDG
jgi:hypothetical protein